MTGVISAGDPQTAVAGAEMLRKGGNAVDAAVAAAFASFIAEIGVVHLGGSGVAQIFVPATNGQDHHCVTYDFFSNMPGLGQSASTSAIDFERVTIDFGPTTQDFYLGRGSVSVPGNIAGLGQMSADYGRLPLKVALEPAIKLAREGLPIAQFQAETCDLLRPIYTNTQGMRDVFANNGSIIQPGDHLYIPDLANTLDCLAKEGIDYSRTGTLAKKIVADQTTNRGLLSAEDLEKYQVRKVSPIRLRYRDYEILLPPPSSSGGVLTAFTLKLLSEFDITELECGSTPHLRLLFEVMAATTRARPFWDRAVEELPVDAALSYFLSKSFVKHYVEEVKSAHSGASTYPALSEPSPHPDTSHISVIDGQGMAVSLTTTAGESAGYIIPGTGYIPNNILGEEDLHPGGFHKRPAGQRIPTMMTPAIVLCENQIRLVVGSGGSIRIRSAIMQVLSNLLDFKMNLAEAVNRPRVHLENGVLHCELGVDPATIDEIEQMGYPVNRWDTRSLYFGGAHSVSRTRSGRLVAAGDSRRGGGIAKGD